MCECIVVLRTVQDKGYAQWIYLFFSLCFFRRILALIVENTFTGIPYMAQLMMPGASSFPNFCFKNKVHNYYNYIIIIIIILFLFYFLFPSLLYFM